MVFFLPVIGGGVCGVVGVGLPRAYPKRLTLRVCFCGGAPPTQGFTALPHASAPKRTPGSNPCPRSTASTPPASPPIPPQRAVTAATPATTTRICPRIQTWGDAVPVISYWPRRVPGTRPMGGGQLARGARHHAAYWLLRDAARRHAAGRPHQRGLPGHLGAQREGGARAPRDRVTEPLPRGELDHDGEADRAIGYC